MCCSIIAVRLLTKPRGSFQQIMKYSFVFDTKNVVLTLDTGLDKTDPRIMLKIIKSWTQQVNLVSKLLKSTFSLGHISFTITFLDGTKAAIRGGL